MDGIAVLERYHTEGLTPQEKAINLENGACVSQTIITSLGFAETPFESREAGMQRERHFRGVKDSLTFACCCAASTDSAACCD